MFVTLSSAFQLLKVHQIVSSGTTRSSFSRGNLLRAVLCYQRVDYDSIVQTSVKLFVAIDIFNRLCDAPDFLNGNGVLSGILGFDNF